MPNNPYNFNSPVRVHEMFYGRNQLLDEIVTNFCSPTPHSYLLVGGRRFGKTSLLRAVERALTKRLHIAASTRIDACTIPIYIDLNFETVHTRGAFFSLVIRLLCNMIREHMEYVYISLDHPYLDQLQMGMREESDLLLQFELALESIRNTVFAKIGVLQTVLLIDESEHILKQNWAPELHANLRALLSNRPKVQDHLGIKMAGSSDFYVKITEVGSPLRNILIKRFLLPLTKDETLALVNTPTDSILSKTIQEEIVYQTGGHPFLVQYLMHNLWQAGLQCADLTLMQSIVEDFHYERDDFESWIDAIGPAGIKAYSLLCKENNWVKRSDIFAYVRAEGDELRRGIESLTYHGVIEQDKRQGYRVSGQMFRSWFEEYNKAVFSHSTPYQPVLSAKLEKDHALESDLTNIDYHDNRFAASPTSKVPDFSRNYKAKKITKDEALIAIRKVLAWIYPTINDSERIAEDAGLDKAFITFSAQSITNWYNVLLEAKRRDKLDRLFLIISNENKDTPAFQEAYQNFLAATETDANDRDHLAE